jgi:predicted dehydrogenase
MLRLGVIGMMGKENGHPFSWSAIVNGDYDDEQMAQCGLDVIRSYLAANKDTLGIEGARVTCVWTQSRQISEQIARASGVEKIVDRLEDMVEAVDAVLLARDDAENHVSLAKPFLSAGIPIFIDKPLANTREALAYFSSEVERGRLLMSCSSMRYAPELRVAKQEAASLGTLELAVAVGKNGWSEYGVHLLEAVFAALDDPVATGVRHASCEGQDVVYVEFETGTVATLHLFRNIFPTFQISLFGSRGWRRVELKNLYAMHREAIRQFVRSVEAKTLRLPFCKTKNIIRTLIGAIESLNQGGKAISLRGE